MPVEFLADAALNIAGYAAILGYLVYQFTVGKVKEIQEEQEKSRAAREDLRSEVDMHGQMLYAISKQIDGMDEQEVLDDTLGDNAHSSQYYAGAARRDDAYRDESKYEDDG